MILSIVIGGAAGQGINTAEQQLLKLLSQKGFYYHTCKDYMSRVRGGMNFTQITLSDVPVETHYENIDLIVALTQEVIDDQIERLTPKGLLICDETHLVPEFQNKQICRLPFTTILKETENPKGISMVALGAVAKVLNLSLEDLNAMMSSKWQLDFLEKNRTTAQKAYSLTQSFFTPTAGNTVNTLSISGNHAVALGALAAGVSFYAAYPMAPSTSVMSYMSHYENQLSLVVEQVEDEISAINAVIGASATGIRAMTSTSGGGFSLMVEGIGLAAVSEVPLVVLDVQRPGPATGMATRTEQSDLNMVLNASQGEFPRIVMSLRHVSDCFDQTFRAFNLADKYRVPVLLLSDQYLADSVCTIPAFDLRSLENERFLLTHTQEDYQHYSQNELVQFRACPGLTDQLVMNDSHEHDAYGHVTESAENRTHMNHRRMQKLDLIAQEMKEPEFYGSESAKTMLLAWGSVTTAAKQAIATLKNEGFDIGLLAFGDLYPLPQAQLNLWRQKNVRFITVEGNYQAQLAQLIARETGFFIEESILKFDGRPFAPDYIVDAFKELI